MRYLFGFMCVVALAISPLSATAQAGEDATSTEAKARVLSSEPARDEGGLSPRVQERTRQNWDPNTYELRLDSSGLSVSAPPPPRKQVDTRVRQARNGLIVSSAILAAGAGIVAGTMVATRNFECGDAFVCLNGGRIAGVTMGSLVMIGGFIGMTVSGSKMADRKQKLRKLQDAKNSSHRIQWDPHTSHFVF
jgi:hypothetical protein